LLPEWETLPELRWQSRLVKLRSYPAEAQS
jgi:hypothetical protein